MSRFTLSIVLLISTVLLSGQGAGFGFQMDFGKKSNFNVGEGYDQSIQSKQYNFFVRWHSNGGKRGHQIVTGLRLDSIGFKNYTNYLTNDLNTLESYNVDAYLKRVAWKFGYIAQQQFIGQPGKFVVSFNYGGFYEFTSQLKRNSYYDNIEYHLYSEQNRHNIILTTGIEARFWFVTVGYKYEHMLFDMINHDYLKTQTVIGPGNNSELRGLDLSPSMSFFYLAFHFDIFNSNY